LEQSLHSFSCVSEIAILSRRCNTGNILKIWAARTDLPTIGNFSAYLFIITRNEVLSLLRKGSRHTVEPFESLEEELWLPDKQLQHKEVYAAVLKAIELLPPARQNVFRMSRMDGRSYEEIAAALNISRNGVKDHIVKALVFLRQHLRQHLRLPLFLFAVFMLFKRFF
jgi:RNA polymerase sigma-70 factor (ECF subfamily)